MLGGTASARVTPGERAPMEHVYRFLYIGRGQHICTYGEREGAGAVVELVYV